MRGQQIDWALLARRVIAPCYREDGLEFDLDALHTEAVAARNGLSVGPLRTQTQRALEGLLLHRSHETTKDFRYAMLWLCRDQLTREEPMVPSC